MQHFTFQEMSAQAQAAGYIMDEPNNWDVLCGVFTQDDILNSSVKPCLEDSIPGTELSTSQSSCTCWVNEEGYLYPLTFHVGYSEHGGCAMYNGKFYSWDTQYISDDVPAEVWALLQKSVWTSPGLACD